MNHCPIVFIATYQNDAQLDISFCRLLRRQKATKPYERHFSRKRSIHIDPIDSNRGWRFTMMKNLRLPVKQFIGFFLITMILIAVVFVGFKSIGNIQSKMQTILQNTPLVDAVKEIKIAVAQDLQVVIALTTALDTDELAAVWETHAKHAAAINQYARSIIEGAQINGTRIYATKDAALKTIVDQATRAYNNDFGPKIRQIYNLMVKKVNAENFDYHLAESLPESAKRDGQKLSDMMAEIEASAKKVMSKAESDAESASSKAKALLFWSAVVGVIVAVALALFITRIITKPVGDAVRFVENMAKGDLTQTLDIDQKDEIGVLAKALNDMVSSLAGMFQKVAQGVHTLSASSEDLVHISNEMSDGVDATSSRSNAVAAAAEEMSTNMNSVAVATEQASSKVNMLADASTRIDAMVSQVSQHSGKAQAISNNAVSEMEAISEAVAELGEAATEIDEVTDVIRDISEQVNLLALNATIEAARAGDAGKGFAVVAQEIKDLAHQTAAATKQADDKLKWIQERSTDLVGNVGGISGIIQEINGIIAEVAGSVEQQKETTQASAENVADTQDDIHVVTDNVNQSTAVSGVIAKDIALVHETTETMNQSGIQINQRAEALNQLAQELDNVINRFRL